MDTKLSSPEATPEQQLSPDSPGSSSSPSSSSSSSSSSSFAFPNPPNQSADSGENSVKVGVSAGSALVVDGGGGGVESENDEEGFVSGEEDFEPAFVGKGNPSEDGGVFVNSSTEFSRIDEQRPIAKVSIDDDDEDYSLGGSEARVSGVNRKFETEEGKTVDGEGDVSLAGDSVVEAVHVQVSASGAAIVGDSEVKGVEVPADRVVELDNEFETLKSVGSKSIESVVEESRDVLETKVNEDSAVEAVQVQVSASGEAIVGNSEVKGVELPALGVVESDNKTETLTSVGSKSIESIVEESRDVLENKVNEDSVVESVEVQVSASGAAIVGDSEVKGIEVPAGGVVELDNEFETLKSDSSKSIESIVDESRDVSETEVNTDSVVEAVQVQLSASGGAIVGDVDDIEGSESKSVEFPGDVKLGNEFDALESVGSKSFESIAVESRDVGEAVDVGPGESVSENVPGSEEEEEEDGAEKKKKKNEVEKALSVNGVSVSADEKPLDNGENGTHARADESPMPKSTKPTPNLSREIELEEDEDEDEDDDEEEEEINGSDTDGEAEDVVYGSAAKQFLEQLERESGGDISHGDDPQRIDGQIITDSEEEVDTDEEEGGGKEMFDSAALAALLKAATGASSGGSGNVTITNSDGSRLFSVERPAGLGSSSLPKFAARPNPSSLFPLPSPAAGGASEESLSEEEKKKLEKFQQLRVKYLRLVNRLGVSVEESISRQVLYRLALVSGRVSSREYSVEAAKATALKLEAEARDDLDFSLNILVVGKTGVGKSATINSIFGEEKTPINAFGPATTRVKEIVGTVDGVEIRVFDTPGLKSAAAEQSFNRKVLSSVKSATKKSPPDIVLYVDRLDTQSIDLNDLPLLRSITSALGPSIWRSGIVTLTHAASSPPDGPAGAPLNYELFVSQRSQVLQRTIGQAVGDLRIMSPSLMNPIALVENHPACRKNRDGHKVLPNGQTWRSQLLHLCYSMKILSEASNASKPQELIDHKKLFGFRTRSPPLPYLLSWLLQSRTHPKLPADQGGDNNADSDIDLDDLSDSDADDEDEYDQLPPFKPLRNSQFAKLTKDQKKAYLEEYDYRVKLLQRKQWKEELKRMREAKKGKTVPGGAAPQGEDDEQENGAPAAVPVALPDMILPPSFDGDNPAYRYRFLEPTTQFLARPVLDTHGWDHDCGYDGVNIEQGLAVAGRFPGSVNVQITKDKKEFNIHLDSSLAARHGETGSTMAGFDIQNVGKQLAYVVRGETKFRSFRKNRTTAGASVTFLGENVAAGVKVEDQVAIGRRVAVVGSAGVVKSQSDAAYGANLEVRLREADFPIGQDQSSLGLSLVKWRGDLALGANLQSQFSVGRTYKMTVRGGLNNKLSGQISIRTSSSEQLQIALVALLPIVKSICKALWPGEAAERYSLY